MSNRNSERTGAAIFYLDQVQLQPGDPAPKLLQEHPGALLLTDEFSQPAGDPPLACHYRKAIEGLDLASIEQEFTAWFHQLLAFLGDYVQRDARLAIQGINPFNAESLTLYLNLYNLFEEYTCAHTLLRQRKPSSVYLARQPAAGARSLFGQALEFWCRQEKIPCFETSGSARLASGNQKEARSLRSQLRGEAGMLLSALRRPWKRPAQKSEVWCIEENQNNLPIYQPLQAEIDHKGADVALSLVSLHWKLKNAADQAGVPGPSPYHGLSLGAVISFVRSLRDFNRAARRLLADPHFQSQFLWAGADAWPLVHARVHRLVLRENLKSSWYLALLERLMVKSRPAAVITTYGISHHRRAVLELARRHAIPTLVLQNAAIPRQLLWSLLPDHPMLVWGEAIKEFLVSLGARGELVQVVGPMKYRQIKPQAEALAAEAAKHGLETGKPVILLTANFTGVWGHYYDWDALEKVMKVASRHPDFQYLVTLHPRTPLKTFEQVACYVSNHSSAPRSENALSLSQARPLPVKVLKEYDIWSLYRLADVVVTLFSTTGIDASVSGAPVINILADHRPDWVGLSQFGASLVARDEASLEEGILRLLTEESQRAAIREGQERYFEAYLHGLDQRAASRVLERIQEIAAP